MSDQVEQSLVVIKLYDEFSQHINIHSIVSRILTNELGMTPGVDYDIVSGFVDDPKLMPDSELASSKQMWFLGQCMTQADEYADFFPGVEVALEVARVESRRSLTKSRASQLIDALKEQTAEARSLAALAKRSQS